LSEPRVSLDPVGLTTVEAKLRGPLEDQLTSALQAATEKITSAYAGQNADQVTAMLLTETWSRAQAGRCRPDGSPGTSGLSRRGATLRLYVDSPVPVGGAGSPRWPAGAAG
jgi:hypothetical protein